MSAKAENQGLVLWVSDIGPTARFVTNKANGTLGCPLFSVMLD